MKTRRISAGIYSILMCAAVFLLCTVTAVYAETGEVAAPTITKQPTALEITYGYESASLSVTAEAAEEHTLSREAGENEGRYAIKVTLGENPNYDITAIDGELVIDAVHSSARSNSNIVKKTTGNGETIIPDSSTNTDATESTEGNFTSETVPTEKYSDVSADSWYFEDVEYVTSAGLMVGTEEGVFEPERRSAAQWL